MSNKTNDVILDSINEGVFTVDSEWRVTSFNSAAERITGVRRSEAIGRPCCEVFRASICETACALRRTMSSGEPVVNATANIVNRAGEQVPIRISTALLKDESGKVIGGVETVQDLSQMEQLRKELHSRYSLGDIIGRSPSIQRLFALLPQISESRSTVLIEGASGTGKELFARAIHNLSPRRNKRFIAINCAALPDTLLESELFGYVAGAFTDAKRAKPGRFVLANNGTIFLDEIGDISPSMQVRLLRVLQERIVEPLGSVEPVKVDVRVIAATNKSLSELIKQGKFREDLYYRIKVVHLNLPPLRERREDLPLLIEHLIAKLNRLQEKSIAGVSDEVLEILMNHSFPGNIRELENILEQAFVLCRGGVIEVSHLPPELRPEASDVQRLGPRTLESMEKRLIFEALVRHSGSRKKAAQDLDIDASTLYRKMKRLNISLDLDSLYRSPGKAKPVKKEELRAVGMGESYSNTR